MKTKFFSLNGLTWLALGTLLQLFVGGQWNSAFAPWLSLIFFLKYARGQESIKQVWVGLLPFTVVTGIAMLGVIPLPITFYLIFIVFICILIYLGFVIDRWVARNLKSFWALLVFPSYLVMLEGLVCLGPYGSWNSLAYTQANNIYLIQLVSQTGIWGITFLIGLTASLLCKVWDERFRVYYFKRLMLPCAGILILVHTVGLLRVISHEEKSRITIGACSVTMPPGYTLKDIVVKYILLGSPKDKSSLYREATRLAQNQLISKTASLANKHAIVIFWSEANAIVFEDDEPRFINELDSLAKKEQIFIFASMALINYGESIMTNKVVILSPLPEEIPEYIKSIIPPGEPSRKGIGQLEFLDAPFGKLGTAICFDLDFPGLLRQAGKNKANIMIVPALDWKEIGTIHAAMAKFRGIENGISMVRHAADGISTVTNPLGQTLAQFDYFTLPDHTFLTQVPVGRIQTLYPIVGDWLLYLCFIFFFTAIILRTRTTPK